MKQLEEKRTIQAEEYWIFRQVSLSNTIKLTHLFQRISLAFAKVQNLQEKIRQREAKSLNNNVAPEPRPNQWQKGPVQSESTRTSSPSRSAFGPTPTNGTGLKIPKKRPVLAASASQDLVTSSNGFPSRPSSTSSSDPTASRPSQTPSSQSSEVRSRVDGLKGIKSPTQHTPNLPKANVIEPTALLSYLTMPEANRPSILFLDVRPKEQYEKGCLNADHVVWIDPILLDIE
jgi:hypothetical protein